MKFAPGVKNPLEDPDHFGPEFAKKFQEWEDSEQETGDEEEEDSGGESRQRNYQDYQNAEQEQNMRMNTDSNFKFGEVKKTQLEDVTEEMRAAQEAFNKLIKEREE